MQGKKDADHHGNVNGTMEGSHQTLQHIKSNVMRGEE